MITLKNTQTNEVRKVQDSDVKCYLGSGWEYSKEEPKKTEIKKEVKEEEPKKEESSKNFKKSRYESRYTSDEEKSY